MPPTILVLTLQMWHLLISFKFLPILTGPFLLTHLLLDKLKESAPSRIVNVISPVYRKSYINFENLNFEKKYSAKSAYEKSKTALASFNVKLAEILDGKLPVLLDLNKVLVL
jgi:NAD(P)-dependent dehydrogenase (short-subunit alcohol dehydrogenase family)